VFDELFYGQLALGLVRHRRGDERGIAHRGATDFEEFARELFPFELTNAQRRVAAEIAADLESSRPMNRLLQGDVGSGKTAVAFLAAALVRRAGRQTAILAPTEILAEQHAANARRALEPHGLRTALLTGSTSTKARSQLLRWLRQGQVDVLIGTHALLEPDVAFHDLGLAVTDEQHRFGVNQRQSLIAKRADAAPDVLVMTATPIPRTLALTAYGDLKTSIIDELPPGRSPTETKVFVGEQGARAYDRVAEELVQGRQAYVIFPLVETSDVLDLKAATDAFDQVAERFAPHRVGLLHGRLKPEEKNEVMQAFARNELQVLVSTTVVEVGVDVPNATCIVIENAERFGLSQLHQLRGRVGRGQHAGRCFLVTESAAVDRLRVLEETSSGFEVAERDLQLRGPGEVLGTRQSALRSSSWPIWCAMRRCSMPPPTRPPRCSRPTPDWKRTRRFERSCCVASPTASRSPGSFDPGARARLEIEGSAPDAGPGHGLRHPSPGCGIRKPMTACPRCGEPAFASGRCMNCGHRAARASSTGYTQVRGAPRAAPPPPPAPEPLPDDAIVPQGPESERSPERASPAPCPRCGASAGREAKLCPACGLRLRVRRRVDPDEATRRCRECGVRSPADKTRCINCGLPLRTN